MREPKITAISDEFNQDLEKVLIKLKSYHIENVELRNVWRKRIGKFEDKELKKVKSLLQKYNFKVSALGSPLFNHNFPKNETEKNNVFKILKRYIEIAEFLETKTIRVFSFSPDPKDLVRNYNDPDSEYMRQFLNISQILKEAGKLAEEHDIKLAIENESGLFGATIDDNVKLTREIDSKNIGVLFDPGNMWRFNDDVPPEKMKEIYPLSIYAHIKDVGKNIFGKRRHVVNGSKNGMMPYVEYFKDMLEAGYDSYFSVETHMSGNKWRNSIKCLEGLIGLLEAAGWDVSQYKNTNNQISKLKNANK